MVHLHEVQCMHTIQLTTVFMSIFEGGKDVVLNLVSNIV